MGHCRQYQNLVSRYLIDVLREEGNKYECIYTQLERCLLFLGNKKLWSMLQPDTSLFSLSFSNECLSYTQENGVPIVSLSLYQQKIEDRSLASNH